MSMEVMPGYEVTLYKKCEKNDGKTYGPGKYANLGKIGHLANAMDVKKKGGRRLLSDVDMTNSEFYDFMM